MNDQLPENTPIVARAAARWPGMHFVWLMLALLEVTPIARAQNTPPTISSFLNITITVGANLSTPALAFKVGDRETAATNLTLSGSSSDPAVILNSGIQFGGSGSNRTVTLTPVPGQIGACTITVTVTDGDGASAASSFRLSVTNSLPTFGTVPTQFIRALLSTNIPITIGDRETPATNLGLTATSLQPLLVPQANVVLGGSGSNRTVQLTPVAIGSGSISLTVTDTWGGQSSMVFNYTARNDPPVIGGHTNELIIPVNNTKPMSFTVQDTETPASNLTVAVSSSNPSLVPNQNLLLGGAGTNRTLTILPVLDQLGGAKITLTVSDGLHVSVSNQITLYVEQFIWMPPTGLPPLLYSSAAWGDFDNDGLLDVAVMGNDSSGGGNRTQIMRNNGDGTFTDIQAGLLPMTQGSLAWGDFDNDGFLDLAVVGSATNGPATKLYHNNGDGTFSDTHAGLPAFYGGQVAWGDYDNDGRPDLAISGPTNGIGNGVRVLHNDGGGHFSDCGFAPTNSSYFGMLAWGDYDNDGNLDLAVSGVEDSTVYHTRIFHNDGQGGFQQRVPVFPGFYGGSVSWGDFDNDGRLDLLAVGSDRGSYPNTVLYRNMGNDQFAVTNTVLEPTGSVGAAWGDCDNDGMLDVAFGWNGNGQVPVPRLFKNNAGIYAVTTNFFRGVLNGTVTWADVNNDGRLDLLIMGADTFALTPVADLYQNFIRATNTPPNAPTGLSATVTGRSAMLAWQGATDINQSGGLSYNLRVGTKPGAGDVLNPLALANGHRCLPALGNAGENTRWNLKNLGVGVYYWSVQAIDNAFAGSAFAGEQRFTITQPVLEASGYASGGPFRLRFIGLAGSTYGVQVSGNLRDWSDLTNVVPLVTGPVEFSDPQAGGAQQRYYRLRLP